jgi:hypothetical protein
LWNGVQRDKDAVSGSVQHIFAKVPSAKIHDIGKQTTTKPKAKKILPKYCQTGPPQNVLVSYGAIGLMFLVRTHSRQKFKNVHPPLKKTA